MSLRALLKSLGQPSSFKGDPYGGLLNQWGHYALGDRLYMAGCLAWFSIAGDMPDRALAAAAVIGSYVAFELVAQGWRGLDTLQDAGYFALGVLTWATSLQHVASEGRILILHVDALVLAVNLITPIAAVMAYGAARTVPQSRDR